MKGNYKNITKEGDFYDKCSLLYCRIFYNFFDKVNDISYIINVYKNKEFKKWVGNEDE